MITPQFALGRIRIDLVIGKNVGVELKKDLSTTSEYQRLLGQLLQLKDWSGKIIIVLVGKTDPNILDDLKKQAKELEGIHPLMFSSQFSIVTK